MKRLLSILLVCAFVLAFAGCGTTPPAATPATSPAGDSPSSGSEAPKLSGKVVVYSPHGDDILGDISDWFKEATGVEVEYLFMGGGELVDRIRAEKANPQADIIYGNPTNVYEEMKQEDLLAKSAPSWAAELDPSFVDADGYYYGTIQTPVMIFYNHDTLSEADAPKDWSDLANPKYAGQIVLRSTTSAASRATISSLIDQYYQAGSLETEGWQFLKDMDKNVKSYVTDSNLMFQEIAKGEAQVGFWTLDGITTNIETNGMPLTIVPPASGAVVISDCIAVINGAKNEANAKAFIEFAGSKEVQLKLAQTRSRIPTLPSAVAEAPEWMRMLKYEVMPTNWANLTAKQGEWLQYYNDEIVDSSKNG